MASWQKTLFIMFIAQMLSAVGFSMIFPFLPSFVEYLGSSTGLSIPFLAAMVFSAQAITMSIASPIWGALSDRHGKKIMVQRSMYGGAVIMMLMAFSSSAEMLVILRAIQGLITGTVAATNALVAVTAPRERTGYAMGVLQLGLWSGVAIGPLLGGILADVFGYRVAFYFTGALLFIGGVLVHSFVQEPETNPRSTKPQSMMSEWTHILASPGIALIFLFRFMSWLGRNILIPYLPFYVGILMAGQGQVNTMTGLTIAIASAAGTLTSVSLGNLGDRIGYKRILIGCAIVAALAYILQFWVANVWQLILLQAITGAAAGGMMPILSALLNQFTTPGEEGAAFGIDNSVTSLSRAVAPLVGAIIVGWTIHQYGIERYEFVFVAAGILFILTALLAVWKLPDPKRLPKPGSTY